MSGIAADVGGGVVDELSVGEHMEPVGLGRGHELTPFIDGLTGDAQRPRYGRLVPIEVSKGVGAAHGYLESTAVDNNVKHSRPQNESSGKPKSPLRYRPMAKPARIKPKLYFNGDVIREMRENREMSLEKLAALVGTTRANISKWELSRRYVAISWDLFLQLSKALYIAPEDLARRLGSPPDVATPPAKGRSRPG